MFFSLYDETYHLLHYSNFYTSGFKLPSNLFKRSAAHDDYPSSDPYLGELNDTRRANEIDGQPLTRHVAVYDIGFYEQLPKKPVIEGVQHDIAETGKSFGKST